MSVLEGRIVRTASVRFGDSPGVREQGMNASGFPRNLGDPATSTNNTRETGDLG